MPKIVPIVEGDGEVAAIPNLLVRVLQSLGCYHIHLNEPINANGRDNLLKPGGVERFLQLAVRRRDCKAVLILLDADDRCPWEMASAMAERLRLIHQGYPTAVVAANCEYEAWFLASLPSISDSYPALPNGLSYPQDVEALAGVKEWLSRQFVGSRIYKPTTDQEPMTRLIDLTLAGSRSRSFRRLIHALEELLVGIDSNAPILTPRRRDPA